MAKDQEQLKSELNALLAELGHCRPTLEPKASPHFWTPKWVKKLLLQLARPFAGQQVNFNEHLLHALELHREEVRTALARVDEEVRMTFAGLRSHLGQLQATQAPAAAPSAAGPDSGGAGQDQTAAMTEALETGFFLRNVSPGATSILDRRDRWDVLFLLDACRFDVMEWLNTRERIIPGELTKMISVGSMTLEWFKNTFSLNGGREARDCEDIVYIAGNPMISAPLMWHQEVNFRFAHLEDAWRDGWSVELQTVPPEPVINAYLRLRDQYPGKRFILHFLQPHVPYIGKTRFAAQFAARATTPIGPNGLFVDVPSLHDDIVQKGVATVAQLQEAYEDNLRLVLGAIAGVLPKVSGRAVVTADHGEMLGEYGKFDHPGGTYLPQLIEVPWLEVGPAA